MTDEPGVLARFDVERREDGMWVLETQTGGTQIAWGPIALDLVLPLIEERRVLIENAAKNF